MNKNKKIELFGNFSLQTTTKTKDCSDYRTSPIYELEGLITRHQNAYYSGKAEITDAEFDQLWDELKRLAPESPVLKRIGAELRFFDNQTERGALQDGFPKVPHLMPMGSQDKAANAAEFRAWSEKTGITRFLVEHKLDGVSLELQYRRGVLTRAVTRGDGIIGDDISANARKVKGVIPHIKDEEFSGGVRGEVIIPRVIGENRYPLTNWRNVANGLLHRLDGADCETLMFIAYDAAFVPDGASFAPDFLNTETGKIGWLSRQGFDTTPALEISGAENVISYRDKIAAERPQIPYNIDGLVVKDIVTDAEDLKENRPKKQIAFKFPIYRAVTILRRVEWSESGATYTPVGFFDEVRLHDTNVKQASLHNTRTIRELGIKTGSFVIVVKRGEIIPKIEGLASEADILDPEVIRPVISRNEITIEAMRSPENNREMRDIEIPSVCETCGTALVDAGTRLYCPNKDCKKKILHKLEKWVSVIEMREMGEKLLRQLFASGRLKRIADFYTLTQNELAGYERMGALSAEKVARYINTPRSIPLARFIAGFDFEGVGELIMEKVVDAGFDTLSKLRAAGVETLAGVYGLGEITAQTIAQGLTESAEDIDAVLKAGIISILPPLNAADMAALPLKGVSFCFTGELRAMKRSEAEARVKELGGGAKSSVVKGLSFLVTNDPASNSEKNKKARELGIPVINEEEFLKKIGS
ncbi:MAG: DNA ligase (NAD(+)) LigA [Spirochaetaceae bacterium]|jgi:DNA ligase (NAD+)|nr:DNA ligase (NAD(+)) LigA [Spirochaetaceae bacterium]